MKRKKKPEAPIQNTKQLRDMLVEVIREVRSGKTEVRRAECIANLSHTILRSHRLDLEYLRWADKTPQQPPQLAAAAVVERKRLTA